MKLSDAIVLGSTQLEKLDPGSWSYCAMGAALAAIGKRAGLVEPDKLACMNAWPWVLFMFNVPGDLRSFLCRRFKTDYGYTSGLNIISWYFHMVCDKEIALEHLVAWVRANEPAEQAVQETTEAPTFEKVNA